MIVIQQPGALDGVQDEPILPDPRDDGVPLAKPQRAMWMIPVGGIVVALVVATITLFVWKLNVSRVKDSVDEQIADARRQNGAPGAVRFLEEYIARNPKPLPAVEKLIARELAAAKREVDDTDYADASKLDIASADLDVLESLLQAYLNNHSEGAHAADAQSRLAQIPREREARAFRAAGAAARAAASDFDLQESAWRSFLKTYPRGENAGPAEAELNKIPERREEAAVQTALHHAHELFEHGKAEEAFDLLAKARDETPSKARRDRIDATVASMESRLETQDREACLQSTTGIDALRALSGRCRLYQLCYPRSTERKRIDARLMEVEKTLRQELRAAAQARLSAVQASPTETVRVVEELLRTPESERPMLLEAGARARIRLLGEKLRDSLGAFQLVTLADGVSFIGTVANAQDGWKQLRRRPENPKLKSEIIRTSDVRSQEEPPLLAAFEQIAKRISATPAGSVNVDSLADELRRLTQDNPAIYVPERQEIEKTAELIASGTPPEAVPMPNLAHFKVLAEQAATAAAAETLQAMPTRRELLLTRNTADVDVTWSLGTPEVAAPQTETTHEGRFVRFLWKYPLISKLGANTGVRNSRAEAETKLAELNQRTYLEFRFDVREDSEVVEDTGIEFTSAPRGIVVRRIIPSSGATDLGLEPGDRLCRVGDVAVPADAKLGQVQGLIASVPRANLNLLFSRFGRRFGVRLDKTKYSVIRYRAQSGSVVTAPTLSINGKETIPTWTDVPGPP